MSAFGKTVRTALGVSALWRAQRIKPCAVLVVGVYLRDTPNRAPQIAAGLGSRRHSVTQAWASVGSGDHGVAAMTAMTRFTLAEPTNKFTIVNRLLAMHDLRDFSYVIVTDDDIELPTSFVDRFIGLQRLYDFALAQPARSLQSNIDHPVTLESHVRMARQTRFVEIGPLFSVAASAFPYLLPFDERCYMGWGLDHVWPLTLEQAGLKMGIVDRTPVHHRFRPVAATYSDQTARERMAQYLEGRATLRAKDRARVVRSYWW